MLDTKQNYVILLLKKGISILILTTLKKNKLDVNEKQICIKFA